LRVTFYHITSHLSTG